MYSRMRGGLRGSVGVWYMILPREAEAMEPAVQDCWQHGPFQVVSWLQTGRPELAAA